MNEWPKVTICKSVRGHTVLTADFENGEREDMFLEYEADLKKVQCAIDNYFMHKNVEGVCSNQSKLQ